MYEVKLAKNPLMVAHLERLKRKQNHDTGQRKKQNKSPQRKLSDETNFKIDEYA